MSLALSGHLADSPDESSGPTSYTDQPAAARWYVAIVIALAMVGLAVARPGPGYGHPLIFLFLLTSAAVAALFRVELPLSHEGATLSLSFAFEFASLLLVGPHATMVIAAISAWVQCAVAAEQRNAPHRTAFSMAAVVFSAQAAGLVYYRLGGTLAFLSPGLVGLEKAIVGAASTYFIANTVLVAAAVALESRQPLRKVFNEHVVWSALGYFVGAGVAAIGVLLLPNAGGWFAPMLIGPLYLLFRTYRLHSERVEAEQHRVRDLSNLHLATLEALALAIDAKDQTATTHIRRVQVLAGGLAEAMSLSEADVQGVRTAALLHDIGKLAVPEHILSKPGPLTQEEFDRMRIHPQVGAEIIANVPFPYPVAPLIRCHHERWDGKGYPEGLCAEQIPLGARILSVVDYFDLLTSNRPFHEAMSPDDAIRVLEQEAGQALDPRVVEMFGRSLPTLLALAAREVEPAQRFSFAPHGWETPAEGQATESRKTVFQDIAHAHREIYALYDIAQSLGTSLGISDTIGLIASKLTSLVPFTTCALYLHENGDVLRCRFASGTDAHLIEPLVIRNDEGLVGWVARHQRSLVNARPNADLEAAGATDLTSLRSALVCPLISQQQMIGVIALYHTDLACFTDDHRRLLERVAEQAAGVVNNAIVYEQTRQDSLTDPLTALPNTRFMRTHLERELARAERLQTEVSLIVMDLDEFKAINDRYGHHAGDNALREVARVLRAGIRPYDICVRYAGDEFVIVLSGCGATEADQKRRELQKAIAEIPFEVRPGRLVPLGSSFGFAVFPHDGQAYDTLLATADKRMYEDKNARKMRQVEPPPADPLPGKRPSVFAKMPRQPAADRTH
jgi:diguanylate cyclase (GGDEF)-like protein/putative nucleotidyltransferase with HDIG domain